MVNNCANPQCAKPLHYLREGRIFVFEAQTVYGGGEMPGHHLEHFWLCGDCSRIFRIERGIDSAACLVPRYTPRIPVRRETKEEPAATTALAS